MNHRLVKRTICSSQKPFETVESCKWRTHFRKMDSWSAGQIAHDDLDKMVRQRTVECARAKNVFQRLFNQSDAAGQFQFETMLSMPSSFLALAVINEQPHAIHRGVATLGTLPIHRDFLSRDSAAR